MKDNEQISGRNSRDMTYDEWLAKFDENNKPKNIRWYFTPKEIYEAVKTYAVAKYGLQGRRVVRPFYSCGDFEKFNYKAGDVVIDNPPFSIMKKIKKFYVENKIDFFLFEPALTMTMISDNELNINYIITGIEIKYENGVKNTDGFCY